MGNWEIKLGLLEAGASLKAWIPFSVDGSADRHVEIVDEMLREVSDLTMPRRQVCL